MTTTATQLVKNIEEQLVLSSLFNIQYPNCRRGMFSLRKPFQNVNTELLPGKQEPLPTNNFIETSQQPTHLYTDQSYYSFSIVNKYFL